MTLSIMATLLLRLVMEVELLTAAAAVGGVSPPPGVAEGGCVMLARDTFHSALTPLTEY